MVQDNFFLRFQFYPCYVLVGVAMAMAWDDIMAIAGNSSISPTVLARGPSTSDHKNQDKDNDTLARNFLTNLKLIFGEAKQGSTDYLSDFTLKSQIDGTEVKAHKIILASQS